MVNIVKNLLDIENNIKVHMNELKYNNYPKIIAVSKTFKIDKILKCNCSICKRKGAVLSLVRNEDFKITKGEDKLKLYKFHSKIAQHFFCSICGIYTHHNPRSNPAMTGFNLGCLDEINTFNLENIQILNGQDHPLDKK